MKFVRFSNGGDAAYGVVDGDTVKEISNSPIGQDYSETGATHDLNEVKILAPNPNPSKMLCLALNYGSHLLGADRPTRPQPFYKNTNAIIGPGDPIKLPADAGLVVCESELIAIIGKEASKVSEADALDYVFGYTAGNDVSAREWQSGANADIQWWRAKSSDTFGPTGPFIVTDIDPQNVAIRGLVNGVEGQKCHSSEMIFTTAQAISYLSTYVTLYPGDMIWTGTSGTTPPINVGGDVTVELEHIGVLHNPVIAG
ncbi:MAG: fumarylacetoacetate hydrolase family protein [Dehalococcoidia bacterium]|jgi:2-keto-4-pentenoate hydratase/2-oxohepta-3-ene-1,7-dioic acid hydratase in catechol pathway